MAQQLALFLALVTIGGLAADPFVAWLKTPTLEPLDPLSGEAREPRFSCEPDDPANWLKVSISFDPAGGATVSLDREAPRRPVWVDCSIEAPALACDEPGGVLVGDNPKPEDYHLWLASCSPFSLLP